MVKRKKTAKSPKKVIEEVPKTTPKIKTPKIVTPKVVTPVVTPKVVVTPIVTPKETPREPSFWGKPIVEAPKPKPQPKPNVVALLFDRTADATYICGYRLVWNKDTNEAFLPSPESDVLIATGKIQIEKPVTKERYGNNKEKMNGWIEEKGVIFNKWARISPEVIAKLS